jgi:hypothetical protein
MRRRSGGSRGGWSAGLLGLVLALGACGGDVEPLPNTARPIVPPETAEEETVEVAVDLPELEAALRDPEPEAAAAPANQPPRIRGMQVDPAPRVRAGQDVKALVDASDPDGDGVEILYTWFVNDDETENEGPVFSTAGLREGDQLRVVVRASDGYAESDPLSSPTLTVGNGAPRIVSQPSGADPDGAFRYQVRAEDPEGDSNLRFDLVRGPRGMRMSARGLIEWMPSPNQSGVHPIEIAVEDTAGARSVQTFELTISDPPAAPAR